VPNELGTCTECHAPTGAKGTGSVSIKFPGALSYTPGVAQQIIVTVADPNQKRWGFQLAARQSSATGTQAGSFTPGTDGFTQLVCFSKDLNPGNELYGPGCSSSTANPLQYIEHTSSGTRLGQTKSATFTFTWTPPASSVGNVVLYVAGNAANGDGTDEGDHIYTANYTLTPAAAANQPAITPNGIVPLYSSSTTIEPGSWNSIYGTNFTNGVFSWDGTFPTSLGGVSVLVNNKPAYLWLVDQTQINFQAPDDTQTGTVTVSVTNSVGTATGTVTLGTYGPTFNMLDGTVPAAEIPTAAGYDLVGPAGHFPGLTTRPAMKGETVELFGTGFGPPTSPVPAGKPFSGAVPTIQPVTIILGGVSISGVTAYEIASGLYQINVLIPQNVGSGNLSLIAMTADSQQTPSNVQLAIQ
jgi:uncharacterized protein (TIGR03437 family)